MNTDLSSENLLLCQNIAVLISSFIRNLENVGIVYKALSIYALFYITVNDDATSRNSQVQTAGICVPARNILTLLLSLESVLNHRSSTFRYWKFGNSTFIFLEMIFASR
jgi:hypothetical protein